MKQKLNYCKVETNDKKKNKQRDRISEYFKIKIKNINKKTTEINNSHIFSPTINITNKKYFIFEPLKNDYTYSRQKRYLKRIEGNKEIKNLSLKNNLNDDILEKPKIKVKVNTIYSSNNVSSSENLSKTIHFKSHKMSPGKKNNKTLIFNYSCIDNRINRIFKNKKNPLKFIKKSFDSSEVHSNHKNKNSLHKNNFNMTAEKSFKSLYNKLENTMNSSINSNKYLISNYKDNKKDRNLCELKRLHKNKIRERLSNHEMLENLSNLKINKTNNKNIYTIDENENINNNYLTNKDFKYSSSLKSLDINNLEFSKLKKVIKETNKINDISINYNKKNSVQNPLYNGIKNTYQKKLVKRNIMKGENKNNKNNNKNINNKNNKNNNNKNNINNNINNNEINNKIYKLENLKTRDDYSNEKKKKDNKYNSPIKIYKSSSFSIYKLFNNRFNGNDNKLNFKNSLNSNLYENMDKKNYHKYSNSYLTNNNNKEETKSQTEHILDNYFSSTSNTFYYNKSNNSLVSQKKMTTNNSELKLKNIITSIDYRNTITDKKSDLSNKMKLNKINKNIVLYEIDKSGKINYKIREMKNSVEKIVRETSLSMKKNRKSIEISPKRDDELGLSSIYVKKNQGTVLRKNKIHKKCELYWTNSNFFSTKII